MLAATPRGRRGGILATYTTRMAPMLPRALPLACLLTAPLLACEPGNLSTTAGDFGVAFDIKPDCIEIDASDLAIQAPFTVDMFVKTGAEAGFDIYPLLVWPGAFALFQDEYQYLIFGPSTETGASTGASSPMDIMDGGYHHVAAMVTAQGEAALYLDGEILVTAPVNPIEEPGSALYIGCWPGQNDATFNGTIGEVRLQSAQHYSGDFAPTWEQYEVTETTLALWHLNEGRGTSILDANGNADGELTNGEWVDFPMPGYDPDEGMLDTGE
jgi:hypothetical protein